MASLFGGGAPAAAPAQQYQMPPAPGTLVQTILSGTPRGATVTPVGETEEERRRRLEMQSNILGSGSGGDSGGTGSATGGNADASSTGAEGSSSDGTL